jgi:uncharacterized protein
MRQLRALVIYLVCVFLGGALVAPWLYWLAVGLAAHFSFFAKLAANPFHRFVDRAFLGIALLGLWPLLRSCRILGWGELGLKPRGRALADIFLGLLLGFASLASVAVIAVLCGGRHFNLAQEDAHFARHIVDAATAAFVVAIIEEILFRGALFGILRKSLEWPAALVISSAVYALAHFLQKADAPGPITWLSGLELLPKMFQGGPPFVPAVLSLFVAGAALALAYQRTGALFFSMGLHAGWIFWVKSFSFLTVQTPKSSPVIWGSNWLVDGWLALPLLGAVFWVVSRIKQRRTA